MENVDSRVRKLEEVIISLNKAIQELYSLIPFQGSKDVQPKSLLHHDYLLDGICDYYGITRELLQTPRRLKHLVIIRKLASRILYLYSDRTFDQVATLVGYKTHPTVIYNIKRTEEALSDEYYGSDEIKKTYSQLLNHLKLTNHDKERTKKDGD